MQISISTSLKNKDAVRRLTNKLQAKSENIVARIALCFSLQTERKFTPEEFNLYDSKGKEYKDHILFDGNREFYIALVCQHYGIYKTDENISKYIKLHVDHGIEELDNLSQFEDYNFFDFLVNYIDKGIRHLADTDISINNPVVNTVQKIDKPYYEGLLKMKVGYELKEEKPPIYMAINDNSLYDNAHIAVAGNSGTGKTQLALEYLYQINKESNGHVKFIYLDFKGLNTEDKDKLTKFFETTHTDYIDVPNTPFPVNPLTFIDNVNEVNRNMGIAKFVDIIAKYSNLGYRQQERLRQATTEAFIDQKNGTYPTIKQINEKLASISTDSDSLTSIMNKLSLFKVFLEDKNNESDFLNKNIYLSLTGNLPTDIRFTSLFLIINYIYNVFMKMSNAPVNENIQALRYVNLIDEAHVIFKEKKYQEILEKILREIRSKGVSVVLLSQGIDEYNQPTFDFSSMCNAAFLLNINDKNPKSIEKFLGISGNDTKKVARSMEKMIKGQAVSNIREFDKGTLFEVVQFRNEKHS
ncbi:MAG: DndE family protein [Bacteroidales bacterium]